jgi:hypothetical protein
VGAWGAWWGPGGRRDGGVPPRPNLNEGAKKLVRENGPIRSSYEKSTDVIRSKQRPHATYLPLISLALRCDGVLYLTRQIKEIDLGVDSKRSEQGNENQHVKKLIPHMFISNP